MRLAQLLLLFTALSWPAFALQDQSQTPPAQKPPAEAPAPVQNSTPAGAQQAPATGAPPSSAKAPKKKKAAKKKAPRKKRSLKHKKPRHKKQADPDAASGPRRIVVRNGSTSETGGLLEPGLPNAQSAHQREKTEDLLQSTDANLKKIARRKLTPPQQDMVRQITFYMEQAKSANKEGDLVRARNLALKAHMLSDELAQQ